MNRPIKFRIWDNNKQEYANPYQYAMRLQYQDELVLHCPMIFSGYNHAYGDFEIQQFTGLLDKNGREIYEGDILKIGDRNKEVIFNMGMFFIDESYGDIVPVSEVDNIVEIIGNKFENPELLKTA